MGSALVSTAVVASALATGWPDRALQWILLIIAALLAGWAPHTGAGRHIVRWIREVPDKLRRWLRKALIGALAVVLAAGVGRAVVTPVGWAVTWVRGCPNPVELKVLTTPDGLAGAHELAAAFEADPAARHHGCAAAHLYVYAQPPDTAHRALASGWAGNHLAALGPRPDVWLPGSTRYALPDPAATSNGLLRAAPARSVASTPVVLAVPAPAAPADLLARRNGLTWAEALAAVDGLGWGLARSSPTMSVSAELGTVAVYASRGGDPTRLADPAAAGTLLDAPAAREIENRIAATGDAQRYPSTGGDTDLLCHHRGLGQARTALIVAEQHLVRFNAGRTLGGPCRTPTTGPPVGTGLLAVYPTDTLHLDHPVVRLDWSRHAGEQRDWARRFEAWLGTDPGRRALNDTGLRPPATEVGSPIGEERGALAGVSYPRVVPHRTVLEQAGGVRAAAQRPGRVLLALDASGSMRRPAQGGRTRFAVAREGVLGTLDLMSGRDEFGLWVFRGRGQPPRELVPVGRGDAPVGGLSRRDATERALLAPEVSGNTPLYRAVVDGVAALSPADGGRASALVVLTDGEDRGSGISPAAMVAAVRDQGVRVFVVAVGEATCTAKPIREVTAATGGACRQAGFADLDARLRELFGMLWRGP